MHHGYMYIVYISYLVEEVEPVDVVLMEDQFDKLACAVQVDWFQLTWLEKR